MRPITPKIMENPRAVMAYKPPRSSPFNAPPVNVKSDTEYLQS
jgi:hypothetical protein